MAEDKWHWQEPETAWKGIGIYHATMTVASRDPLLGTLIIPDNDPTKAYVDLTAFGEQIKACIRLIPEYHPQIQLLGIRMMPDHVHFIMYVKQTMPVSIKSVVRGFWQGARKHGRTYSLSISPNTIRDNQQRLSPIFTDMPFIRPLSRRGQLDAMMQYVKMNPQRLATKRLKPGYFCVQEGIEIAGRIYAGVGNTKLLLSPRFETVHVRHDLLNLAAAGNDHPLRDYMNGCVIAARQGSVMVSPFISAKEKEVLIILLTEEHPTIILTDNGFGQYYKPSAGLFDAVAAGKLLILSPWQHDPGKKHISRADCVALNTMAEEISSSLSHP